MDADLVKAAATLRWARPDLTAELADHVLEEASAAGQRDRWLAAAGWAVHARAATGDGRDIACAVLAALERWGSDALAGPASDRLRVELAMVAAGAGEVESARGLLAGVHADDDDPELAADLLCAHARCAVEDSPDEVAAALDAADAAWAVVDGPAAEIGGASVALVRAVVERRAGRPATAVDHASDGLARLERGRVGSGTPSGYLAAALAAEWISALLDAGRIGEARDGCSALLPRLSEQARPTRQLALLRLTVTRVLAAQDPRDGGEADTRAATAQLLAQAAEDATGCDMPDLEAVCRTALGALHEQAEQLDVALEALQLAVGAERRDRDRSRRLLAALAELPTASERPKRRRKRAAAPASALTDSTISTDATTVLPAITRSDRKLRASRGEHEDPKKPGVDRPLDDPEPVAAEVPAFEETAWDAVPWNGSGGESPIGDLLIRSLRAGEEQSDEHSSPPRRNGKPVAAHGSEEPNATSGWVPTLEGGDEPPRARRRGRTADPERRRTRRSRDEREDAQGGSRHAEPAGGYTVKDTGGSGVRERPRRSRHGGGEATEPGERPTGGRHGSGEAPADPGSRAGRGGRRRAEDKARTVPWSSDSEVRSETEAVPEVVPEAVPVPEAAASSDGWLQSALAELDRALSGIGVGKPVPIELREPAEEIEPLTPIEEPPQSDDGCAVVVDIARDGRRFAGPRAAAVVRSVAELVADQLPAGARTRFGDSDALVITGAGWSRSDATGWMHRRLPGLLDGFVAAEELPGAQLRVAVHDADGPVGAQILQPLIPGRREREAPAERRHEEPADPWGDLVANPSETRGQEYRPAANHRPERGTPGGADGDTDDVDFLGIGSTRWPFSGDTAPPDPAPSDEGTSSGRHGSDQPAAAQGGAVERGRRHRAEAQARPSGELASVNPGGSGRAARRRSGEAAASTGSNGSGSNGSAPNGAGSNGAGSNGAGSNGAGSNGTGVNGNGSPGNGLANGAHASAGGSGRRAKRDAGTATATEPATATDSDREETAGEPARAESTENLGIADLLAGALAAYRGI